MKAKDYYRTPMENNRTNIYIHTYIHIYIYISRSINYVLVIVTHDGRASTVV